MTVSKGRLAGQTETLGDSALIIPRFHYNYLLTTILSQRISDGVLCQKEPVRIGDRQRGYASSVIMVEPISGRFMCHETILNQFYGQLY